VNSSFTHGQLGDRWVEVDLDWFMTGRVDERTKVFAERVSPLLKDATGEFGVVVNVGWISDLIYLWQGVPNQPLPLESSRLQKMKGKTYQDLKIFFSSLRKSLADLGHGRAKLGVMVVGWGAFVFPEETGEYYDIESEWKRRQPHLYAHRVSEIPATDLDLRLRLNADVNSYASFPNGLEDGADFGSFVSKQWAALASFLEIEVLHLRDGWFGPMIYRRSGYYGIRASADPLENATWSAALAEVCSKIKIEKPETFLMLYSSALGANVENLIGCIDMEQVVAGGNVDAFIDQSWGGAWQDWWPMQSLGWTFQLQNILSHAAELRRGLDTKTRHYYLIETFDGWEPWDTLHRTPQKLQWAIWAYAHAMALTAEGLQPADGAYISWINNPYDELLSQEDIEFLSREIRESVKSALSVNRMNGVAVVHNREAINSVKETNPDQIQGLIWEDDLAMASKWGFPIGPVVHSADSKNLSGVLYIPRPTDSQVDFVESLRKQGSKAILAGNPEQIPPSLASALGLLLDKGLIAEKGLEALDLEVGSRPGWEVVSLDRRVVASETGVGTALTLRNGEPLVIVTSDVAWWQPPTPSDQDYSNILTTRFGTFRPFRHIADTANNYLSEVGEISIDAVQAHETIVLQSWQIGSETFVLMGNVESAVVGDSRWPRKITLNVPKSNPKDVGARIVRGSGAILSTESGKNGSGSRICIEVAPESFTLLVLTTKHDGVEKA
jgi:hypothetical protein